MRHTLVDRLLLGKNFTFQSDLSPAECVARIRDINTVAPQGETTWYGSVWQFKLHPDRWMFEVRSAWLFQGRIHHALMPHLVGTIEQDHATSASVVNGVARCSPFIGCFIGLVIGLLILTIPVFQFPTYPWSAQIIGWNLALILMTLAVVRRALRNRARIITRLERSLQVSYRTGKAEQS